MECERIEQSFKRATNSTRYRKDRHLFDLRNSPYNPVIFQVEELSIQLSIQIIVREEAVLLL